MDAQYVILVHYCAMAHNLTNRRPRRFKSSVYLLPAKLPDLNQPSLDLVSFVLVLFILGTRRWS